MSTTTVAPIPTALAATEPKPARRDRRRLGLFVWALLFFNGLAFNQMPLLVPIPTFVGKLLTQGALALAVVLALWLNRDRVVRPNLFLTLFTVLALASLTVSIHAVYGFGTLFRAGRFCAFVAVLWLLTPLFGRPDRTLLKWHVTCLLGVLSTVVVGFFVAPGRARQTDGRLGGQLWPIPPTQVGHYAAVLAGIVVVLGLCGVLRARAAMLIAMPAVAVLLLSHTRTALIAMIAGVIFAMLSVLTMRRRVRQALIVAVVLGILGATVLAPALRTWFARGESSELVGQLNGRRTVWNELVQAPRTRVTEVFGIGLTNKSFAGLPIDNSWLATYQDQGLLGDALCAAILLSLLLLASMRPRGPGVAIAVFLVVYCAIASFTETGLGDVSPYVLDLTVAASLLALPGDGLRAVVSR
ncbi:MAG TPA: O-antigen ligase family protein [Acidimicrobiia bacterium]|nr:O-antigen ligase family protein [Acidimicrobiia bacterium]